MVNMFTRHLLNIHTTLKIIFTHSTLSQFRTQQSIVNSNGRKRIHSRLRSRRCSVSIRIVLGQLLNQLLEPWADEVIAEVSRKLKPLLRRRIVGDNELDVGTASGESGEVVLEKSVGIEHVRVLGIGRSSWREQVGEVSRVLGVTGRGGEEKRETTEEDGERIGEGRERIER